MYGFFLILSIKLQQHKGLKFFQMIFLEKNCTGFFAQKVAQNEFFEFGNKSMHWIFGPFAWSCSSLKTEN